MVKHLRRHLHRRIKKLHPVHTLSLFAILAGVGFGIFMAMQPTQAIGKTAPECVAAEKTCKDKEKAKGPKGDPAKNCPPEVKKTPCKDSGMPCEGFCVYGKGECKGTGKCSGNKEGKPKGEGKGGEEKKKEEPKGGEGGAPKLPEMPKEEPKKDEPKKPCEENPTLPECAKKPEDKSIFERAEDKLKEIVDKGKEALGIETGAAVIYGTEDKAGKDIQGRDPQAEEQGKLDTVKYAAGTGDNPTGGDDSKAQDAGTKSPDGKTAPSTGFNPPPPAPQPPQSTLQRLWRTIFGDWVLF